MSIARRYSGSVADKQALPALWLLSDARNDAVLEDALARLPRGSGFVFRHNHLDHSARRARFSELASVARAQRHLVILSDHAAQAEVWGADGIYGPPAMLAAHPTLLRFAAVHDREEIALANRAGASAVFLSPVFPTRSHPGAACLGAEKFRELATLATMPVIALGGMTAQLARVLDWPRWAAIDGLS